ncbi:hypothetical protein HEP87_58565 [Streptomyces sp. S1D4-11]
MPTAIFTPALRARATTVLACGKISPSLRLEFGRGPGQVHSVDQGGRGDEEGAALGHQLDGLVVQQEAVLDAVDA